MTAIPAYMARMLEGATLFQMRASGKKRMNSPSSHGGGGVSKATEITFVYICSPTFECDCSCPPCRQFQKRILEEYQTNNDDGSQGCIFQSCSSKESSNVDFDVTKGGSSRRSRILRNHGSGGPTELDDTTSDADADGADEEDV